MCNIHWPRRTDCSIYKLPKVQWGDWVVRIDYSHNLYACSLQVAIRQVIRETILTVRRATSQIPDCSPKTDIHVC